MNNKYINALFLMIFLSPVNAGTQTNDIAFDLMYEQIDFPGLSLSFINPDTEVKRNNNPEYYTFNPGFEPPLRELTIFPGLNSEVDVPTIINCQTYLKSNFQGLINRNCNKEV